MNLLHVNSFDLPQLQIYARMRDNAVTADNSFIADGEKVVVMLLQSGVTVRSLLATAAFYEAHEALVASADIPQCYVATKQQMATIIGHRMHQNVMLHGVRPPLCPLEQLGSHVVMLDLISRNENVGAIIRSMAALGVGSLVAPVHGPRPFGRRALRVSMGHAALVKTHLYEDMKAAISALKALGYTIVAAETHPDAIALQAFSVPEKWVLLVGNEDAGIADDILALCDAVVMIEMAGAVKSFNVAVAASILLYQFRSGIRSVSLNA